MRLKKPNSARSFKDICKGKICDLPKSLVQMSRYRKSDEGEKAIAIANQEQTVGNFCAMIWRSARSD